MALYIPGRGDIINLNFSPQAGHERAVKRPAIVLSDQVKNLDWKVRKAEFVEHVSGTVVA